MISNGVKQWSELRSSAGGSLRRSTVRCSRPLPAQGTGAERSTRSSPGRSFPRPPGTAPDRPSQRCWTGSPRRRSPGVPVRQTSRHGGPGGRRLRRAVPGRSRRTHPSVRLPVPSRRRRRRGGPGGGSGSILRRASASGGGTSTRSSKRPDRRSAVSTSSTKFVAPTTTTSSAAAPSSSVNS